MAGCRHAEADPLPFHWRQSLWTATPHRAVATLPNGDKVAAAVGIAP